MDPKKLMKRSPNDWLIDPFFWPGRGVDPQDSNPSEPLFRVPIYGLPRIGPWSKWKNPGCPPGTPGSA